MLSPERWQLVERIFHEAASRPAEQRAAFIETSCAGDQELKKEVVSLLAADTEDDQSRDSLAAHVAADWAGVSTRAYVGREVGGYRITALLGRGGMGETYLAEDCALGRPVALKFLPKALSSDARRVRRFEEEARAASALNHPGILTVYGTGDFEGQRYIATEFIDGETVRARLTKGPLPVAEALDIAIQAAQALAAAHGAGIVHRDIKPENLMVRRDGYVKIIDFGLAKPMESGEQRRSLSRVGDVMGTVDYMAPEQASGGPVDARADLYGLAVVLCEMLTGELPRALGDGGALPAPVLRVIRRGLAADPARRYQTAAEFQRELEGLRGRIGRPPWRRWAAIGAAAVVMLTFGVYRWTASRHSIPAVRSLLVMPLQPLQESDRSHLEEGLTEALITRLGSLKQLHVKSGAALKADEDPFEAARRLGVEMVLTGLVQRAGDRLRVTAQLSRVADRDQIWAAQYDEVFTNIFGIEDAISEKVAANLVTEITEGDHALLVRHETQNPEAYDLYLRARHQWDLRTPATIRNAIDMYRQAIVIEPDFALAYAGLADAYNLAVSGMAPLTRAPLARAAAERALQLDPQSAEGHTALAFLEYKFEWKWEEADHEFQRAIALNPHYALAHHWYGEMLKLLMRHDESIQQFRQAVEADPFSIPIRYDFILALLNAGRVAEARTILNETRAIDPTASRTIRAEALVLAAEGRMEEAIETGFQVKVLVGTSQMPAGLMDREVDLLRAAYRAEGLRGLHRKHIALLLARFPAGTEPPPHTAGDLADGYATLQDREETLRWLKKAVDLDEDEALLMLTHHFDFLRQDAAFLALERRVGLLR